MDKRILIVDDSPDIVHLLRLHLTRQGYDVVTAGTGAEAVAVVRAGFRGLVILDLMLPDFEGLDLFDRLHALEPRNRIIIITAHGTFDLVTLAIKRGAYDFLSKGEDMVDRLFVSTKNAFAHWELESTLSALQRELDTRRGFRQIIAQSPAMEAIFRQLRRVVDTKVTVLITGESGTGKELVAKALHQEGSRANAPFVAINCAGIPETLLESELFGYERGAFTGAVSRKLGRFELANGGTIFLDEIGEMKPALQAKLLRVLQEREFERVGGTEKVRVDVRVLSATHRDLEAEVAAGRFRQDLYYRLAVFTVRLPPLRERRGDVRLLAHYFTERFAREEERPVPQLTEEAMQAIEAYDFPGNVRELENVISHAAVVCSGREVRASDLPPVVTEASRNNSLSTATDRDLRKLFETIIMTPEEIPRLADVERELTRRALDVCEQQVAEAADRLGTSRATMYRRVASLGLKR